jgi:GR25 family glycosyltransferase involved in LPS biosynthesis
MYWDCIYIVNLKRMKTRYDEVVKRLNQIGINTSNSNIVRWEAVDGSIELPFCKEIYETEDIDKKKELLDKMNNTLKKHNYISKKISKNFRPGQIGVYCSFMQIIRDAKNKKYEKVLILEDDVFFVSNFLKRIDEFKDRKEDVIFLGTSHTYWNDKIKKEGKHNVNWQCPVKKIDNALVDYPVGCLNEKDELNNGFLGTFGYSVNKSGYDKILKRAFPMRYAFDVYLGKLYHERQITTVFLKDSLIYVTNIGEMSHTGSLQIDGSKNKITF